MITSPHFAPEPHPGRTILLAEDDVDDQEFLIEAFHQIDASLKIHVESSGEKALEYLNAVSDNAMPCLIVLDYNLPKINGQQILQMLSEQQRFKNVIKLVWSTSNSELYEQACLEAGADAYLVKPNDLSGIARVARTMLEFCN